MSEVASTGGPEAPSLCVRPSNDCSGTTPDFPPRCAEIDLCEPDLEQTVTDAVGEGDLGSIAFDPENIFDPPVEAPDDPYIPDDDPCMGSQYSCEELELGHGHPWCVLDSADPTPPRPDREPGHMGNSDGSLVSFQVNPAFKLTHSADVGAFGLPELDVTAEAGFSASVTHNIMGSGGTVTIIDALAALDADECGVRGRSRLDILEKDIIDPSFEDVTLPDETAQEDCRDAVAAFREAANRAKKALRDAVELRSQYYAATRTGDPNDHFHEHLCRDIVPDPPRGFPPGNCPPDGPTESPEDTINRFIGYYHLAATTFGGTPGILGLQEAADNLANDAFAIDERFPFLDFPGYDQDTVATAQFFIGPIPVFLEVLATADYGVTIGGSAQFNPGVMVETILRSASRTPAETLAFVKVDGTPWAGAGLGVFAGAGFGVPGFEAKVGLQADLMLGTIRLPAYAGAGIGLGAEVDDRDPPSDIAPFVTGRNLITPKRYVVDLRYSAGLGLKLRDILSGSISGKLKISVLFFSKTWRKTLMNFEGICGGDPDGLQHYEDCDFDLISFEGSANAASGSFPWAEIRMPTPFPYLDPLTPGEATPGSGYFVFSTVDEFFFDSLCTCIDGDNLDDERECFRDDDCCYNTPNCFEEQDGTDICIDCRQRGTFCREDADCCGHPALVVCNETTQLCEGRLSCSGICTRDDECVDGEYCMEGGCDTLDGCLPE